MAKCIICGNKTSLYHGSWKLTNGEKNMSYMQDEGWFPTF